MCKEMQTKYVFQISHTCSMVFRAQCSAGSGVRFTLFIRLIKLFSKFLCPVNIDSVILEEEKAS